MNNLTKIEKIAIILTIVAVFMVFGGIGYAFFTMNDNTGSTAEITNTSGKMTITYADGGSNLLVSDNIVPSDAIIANKTFTLTGLDTSTAGNSLAMPYKVGIKYTSSFSDGQIHYYIKKVSSTNNNITTIFTGEANQTVPGNDTYTGYNHGTLNKGSKYTEMVTGEFPASSDSQTITFNLVMQFPDNGKNQDTEKGKSINAEVVVNYEIKATTFANDSWDTIAAVIQNGDLGAYQLGAEKEVEIDGKNYTVRVANNTTPEECNLYDFSQTACGFVVEFVDVVEKRAINNTITSVGGWPASEVRTYANGVFFNKLPSDLQNVIIDTNVISSHGSTLGETNFLSTDKIYLLSAVEVWNNNRNNISSYDSSYYNTRQLDYYNLQGVTTSNFANAIKQSNGSSSTWWLRSSFFNDDFSFIYVGTDGNWYYTQSRYNYGFAPAFRIG